MVPRFADFQRIVFFTGAGLSAESGIPTFRGKGGMWSQYNYEDYACQAAFDRDPEKVWDFHDERRRTVSSCEPNAGHRVIAEVQKRQPNTVVITQNIDGMHQRAGAADVVELHGSLWRVAIGDPDHPNSVAAWVEVTDMAVVTAGNYEQYFTVGGQVYGHIINPHTGYPSIGLRSVTILCPDVELADGLDEVVFVKGPVAGLAFINRLKGVDCTLITDDNRTLASRGMTLNWMKRGGCVTRGAV